MCGFFSVDFEVLHKGGKWDWVVFSLWISYMPETHFWLTWNYAPIHNKFIQRLFIYLFIQIKMKKMWEMPTKQITISSIIQFTHHS